MQLNRNEYIFVAHLYSVFGCAQFMAQLIIRYEQLQKLYFAHFTVIEHSASGK